MKLVDINTGFGGRESVQDFGAQALLSELDRTPVSAAFAHGYQGAIDHTSANAAAFDLAVQDSRIQVCGSIDPRDVFTWREEVDRCLAHGVQLFKIVPGPNSWSVDSVLTKLVIEHLAGSGSALLVDASTSGIPTRITEIAEPFDVSLVFSEARYFPLTELIPLAQRFPQVHIETSRLTSPGGIALCVQEVGADRLLYGSGAPRFPAQVAWRLLDSAPIADSDKQKIAWENAARLLHLQVEEPPVEIRDLRPFAECVDVHLHDKFPGAPFPPYDPVAYKRELSHNEVRAGICSSISAITHDLQQGNEDVAWLLDDVERLRGYVVVDPRYPEISRNELRRLDTDKRFVGVKIHCAYSQTPTNADSLSRLFDDIGPYERPVLIHNLGADWPEALGKIAERHPSLPLIAAHAGYGDGPTPTHDAADRVAAHNNIYLEFCSTHLAPGAIRRGIEAVGADRLLFGSDFPLISLPYMRLAYSDAELSREESMQIRTTNPVRLFPSLTELVHS